MPSPAAFLVIDSDDASRSALARKIVAIFPRSVIQERSGLDAAALSNGARSFDAVIYRLHKSEGLAVVRRLRRANPAIGILVIADRDQSAAAFSAGASDFLRALALSRLEHSLKQMVVAGASP